MTKRERERRARLAKFDTERWRGTRETGVFPKTTEVLVAAGWLEVRPTENGQRLVYKLTEAGVQALAEIEVPA